MKEFILDNKRKELLLKKGHLLVKGGPGSGKTTISLLKASDIINKDVLKKGQKILFLSFARATVSRMLGDAELLIEKQNHNRLEINTYHGFSWSIIKSYGNLIVKHKPIRLLTPPDAASLFFRADNEKRQKIAEDLLANKGVLSFDLFANLSSRILTRSERIRKIFSNVYPYIFVDEFQDTNQEEWKLIKQLGMDSTIIALADPYQRIYDFRGADPKRLAEFQEHFNPFNFDFGNENNRSNDTDIAIYGNDILTGKNKVGVYKQVRIEKYKFYSEQMAPLKYAIYNSAKRLNISVPNRNWSVAILVRSKKMTLAVSSYLSKASPGLGRISHEVLIDPAGPALSAVIISSVLEPLDNDSKKNLILNVLAHIKGRKDKPSQDDFAWSEALNSYLQNGIMKGSKRLLFMDDIDKILSKRSSLTFTGIPENDWLTVRKLFEESTHSSLKDVFEDSKYLRLLNKGALLSSRLSESWRMSQSYAGAKNSIKDALLQEHFSMSHRKWNGIFVMTLHKSKGKEFDEVIIWEDQYNSIVPYNANTATVEQSKLVLRVGVTRAKKMTTICTPFKSPCILI